MKKHKLVVSNMYRAKNKTAFFAMHQISTVLNDFDIEFHILWDDIDFYDDWTDKINHSDFKIVSYTKQMLDQYCLEYGISKEFINTFDKFKAVYFIIHAHYLKKNSICNYYLIYDDDIILSEDIEEFKQCLRTETPLLICEPMNSSCDKVLTQKLLDLYGGEEAYKYYLSVNPRLLGFNAGIQGISLDMYEDFLEPEYFNFLLNIFNYTGIYDSTGKEITGPERTAIDTQQQSFFGTMNIIRSKTRPVILDPKKYFICPNWGYHPEYGQLNPENEYEGWDVNMKSKIIHFIGHTVLEGIYYGKSKQYHKLVDVYLKKHNLI